jgi:hypothetical protein
MQRAEPICTPSGAQRGYLKRQACLELCRRRKPRRKGVTSREADTGRMQSGQRDYPESSDVFKDDDGGSSARSISADTEGDGIQNHKSATRSGYLKSVWKNPWL